MRISDWSSDVCSSDLGALGTLGQRVAGHDVVAVAGDDGVVAAQHDARPGEVAVVAALAAVAEAVVQRVAGDHVVAGMVKIAVRQAADLLGADRKSTRLNSSH